LGVNCIALANLNLDVEVKRRFRKEDQRNTEELRRIARSKHRHLGKYKFEEYWKLRSLHVLSEVCARSNSEKIMKEKGRAGQGRE